MEIRNNSKIELCFIFDDVNLRRELSRPYGILFVNNKLFLNFLTEFRNRKIITVGDYVSAFLETNGILPFLEIVDGKTRRKIEVESKWKIKYKIKNEAGVIRLSAFETIREALSSGGIILVEGEEDLLVIPVIMYSELGSFIIYGQPGVGAVVIINNNVIRWRTLDLLNKAYVKKC